MGKLIIPFDPVMMRWLNDASGDSSYQEISTVFENGYDDPTYMTFRIEFGGWGATTIPSLNTYKLMQRINTVDAHGNISSTTPTNYRYDDYPCGLLDLNFADESIKAYPGYAFNNQVTYNAYNYLLQRNEDTRAFYLKQFIEGLYEIQRKYPYLFQKISGISNLTQVSTTRGTRLKDVQITLECIEGLAQKISTLMELYYKAAWDAVWQRWILPENYRQFKMIIYVFERRVFHSVEAPVIASSIDDNVENNESDNWKQKLGKGVKNFLSTNFNYTAVAGGAQIAPQANPLGPHPINSLLPVYAYECDLCEFALQNEIQDSYEANWNDSTAHTKTIKINVKNVRTYFKNGLTKQLKNILIYDLASAAERFNDKISAQSASYNEETGDYEITKIIQSTQSPVNNWISRDRIYENEQGISFRPGWGGGGNTETVDISKQWWDNLTDNWKKRFKNSNITNNNPIGSITTAEQLLQDASIQIPEQLRSEWVHVTFQPNNMLKNLRTGSFWENLLNSIICRDNNTQIKVKRQNDKGLFTNQLPYVNIDTGKYNRASLYFSTATQQGWKDASYKEPSSIYHNVMDFKTDRNENSHRSSTTNVKKDNVETDNPLYTYADKRPENSFATIKEEIIEETTYVDREIENSISYNENLTAEYASKAVDNSSKIQQKKLKPRDLKNKKLTEKGKLEKERTFNKQQINKIDLNERVLNDPEHIDFEHLDKERVINNDYELHNVLKQSREIPNIELNIESYNERELPEYDENDMYMLDDSVREIDEYDGYYEDNEDSYTGIILDSLEEARDVKIIDITKDILSGRELPDNVILDRTEFLDIISKATTVQASDAMQQDNLNNLQQERQIINLLQDQDTSETIEMLNKMSTMEKNKNTLYGAVADLASNPDKIKNNYQNRIETMQASLKEASQKVIQSLPSLPISAAEKNPKDLDKDLVILPNTAVERIQENHVLYSIDNKQIRELSIPNLEKLDQTIREALIDTEAMNAVIRTNIISKATSRNKLVDEQAGIIHKEKIKISTSGKELLG